jgi:hypothetical protein
MSDTETKPETALTVYQSAGLNEAEAKSVAEWVEKGKPGLARSKAESLGSIYLLGYTCQEIARMFPEYDLPLLLYARVEYGWDQAKLRYKNDLQESIIESAKSVKLDSTQFMSEMIKATHVKWRADILRYLAAPDRVEPPACLPNTLHGYQSAVTMLNDLIEPKVQRLPGGGRIPPSNIDLPPNQVAAPLVSVTVNQSSEKPAVEVTSKEIPQDAEDPIRAERRRRADEKRAKGR